MEINYKKFQENLNLFKKTSVYKNKEEFKDIIFIDINKGLFKSEVEIFTNNAYYYLKCNNKITSIKKEQKVEYKNLNVLKKRTNLKENILTIIFSNKDSKIKLKYYLYEIKKDKVKYNEPDIKENTELILSVLNKIFSKTNLIKDFDELYNNLDKEIMTAKEKITTIKLIFAVNTAQTFKSMAQNENDISIAEELFYDFFFMCAIAHKAEEKIQKIKEILPKFDNFWAEYMNKINEELNHKKKLAIFKDNVINGISSKFGSITKLWSLRQNPLLALFGTEEPKDINYWNIKLVSPRSIIDGGNTSIEWEKDEIYKAEIEKLTN